MKPVDLYLSSRQFFAYAVPGVLWLAALCLLAGLHPLAQLEFGSASQVAVRVATFLFAGYAIGYVTQKILFTLATFGDGAELDSGLAKAACQELKQMRTLSGQPLPLVTDTSTLQDQIAILESQKHNLSIEVASLREREAELTISVRRLEERQSEIASAAGSSKGKSRSAVLRTLAQRTMNSVRHIGSTCVAAKRRFAKLWNSRWVGWCSKQLRAAVHLILLPVRTVFSPWDEFSNWDDSALCKLYVLENADQLKATVLEREAGINYRIGVPWAVTALGGSMIVYSQRYSDPPVSSVLGWLILWTGIVALFVLWDIITIPSIVLIAVGISPTLLNSISSIPGVANIVSRPVTITSPGWCLPAGLLLIALRLLWIRRKRRRFSFGLFRSISEARRKERSLWCQVFLTLRCSSKQERISTGTPK